MASKIIDIAKAWEELKWESLINKPANAPYPDDVSRAREYLLLAQALLAKYEVESIPERQEELANSFNEAMTVYRKQMYQTKN